MSRLVICIRIALICTIITSHGLATGEPAPAAPYYIYDTSAHATPWSVGVRSSIQALSVRIKLSIEPLTSPSLQQSHAPAHSSIHKTLRAYLRQSSHFVFDTYHIETIPLAWNPTEQTYAIRLSVSQQLSSHDGMAQHLGYLDLHGNLKPQALSRYHQIKYGGAAIYMLMGTASKVFHIITQPHSSFKITAGFQANSSAHNPDAKISTNHLSANVLPMSSSSSSPARQPAPHQAKFHQNQSPAPAQPKDQATPLLFNLKDYEPK